MPFDEWMHLSNNPLVPLAIPVEAGRQYKVTQTGVDAAHTLAAQTWRARQDLRQTLTRPEFDKIAFHAIGRTILDCREHLPDEPAAPDAQVGPDFYAAVAQDFSRNVDRLADAARPDVDRHIPCHLFHGDQAVPAFAVGPIEFLPRADWIVRYVRDPELAHIQRVETGAVSYSDFREQALQAGSDRNLYRAWEILSSLRNFEWVATIRMRGHALSQSHQKASILVGLAIDTIGLRFQVEDARRFTKAGRQHLFGEERLATSPSGGFLRGSSVQMPGLGSAPGALATKMRAERPFLDAAGKIIDAFVTGRQSGRAPHLVERWANALYWVGEARREASDFMAVVDYGCAADGLTGAKGKTTAITSFAEAALNPKQETTPAGMLSVAKAVSRVYREGRNKLAHGETAGLFEDLSETRAIGDALLVSLFDAVTLALAETIDNRPDVFELDEQIAFRFIETKLKQRS
uniref:Apea-like HEPN domain-containing protein n=1 Tax=Rhodopseudomonas palustris (strain DX-1) TaxID=652103 RepID=E6VPH6_RHOPX